MRADREIGVMAEAETERRQATCIRNERGRVGEREEREGEGEK